MINYQKLQECLSGLIGFKNSLDKDLPKVSEELAASSSSVYINEQHALLTVPNIIACIEEGGTISLPEDVEKEDILDYYIQKKINQSIIDLTSNIFVYKNLNDSSKTVLGDALLFSGSGNIRNTIAKKGRFVGFKIFLKEEGLSLLLSRIGFQFSLENPEFKLYLYHSSQLEPIHIYDLALTKAFSFEWKDLQNAIMSYSGDHADGGHFSIGYYEDDLQGEAIERNVPIYKWKGCHSCNPANFNIHNKRSAYVSVLPFYIDADNLEDDRTLWDEEREMLVDEHNWGMNLKLSVMCDVSDIFCRNKYAIAKPLAMQVAINILQDMAYGTRDNQKFEKVSQLAMYALEDRDNRSPGMKSELKTVIKALSFNFSGINERCLPCDLQNQSIEFGTIY